MLSPKECEAIRERADKAEEHDGGPELARKDRDALLSDREALVALVAKAEAALVEVKLLADDCGCSYSPCGCGERCGDAAEDGLDALEKAKAVSHE